MITPLLGLINANLANLATIIFRKWLTTTASPIKLSLDSIANYKNGLAMQKFRPTIEKESLPVLKIRELNQGYTDDNSDRCTLKIPNSVKINTGDIIFSWSGTLSIDMWSGEQAGLNQHLFKVTSDIYPAWFIFEWTKYYLQEFKQIAKAKATTMGHIKRADLKNSIAIIPTKSELMILDNEIRPLFEQQKLIRMENNNLIKIKTQLLTRLLN